MRLLVYVTSLFVLILTACGGKTDHESPPAGSSSSANSSISSSSLSSSPSSSSSSEGVNQSNIAPLANATTSYVSPWETLAAVNNNSNPSNSNDKSNGAYGNWDTANTRQWVQYVWPEFYALSATEIYWMDDNGGVRIPTTAYLEYWDGDGWVRAGDLPRQANRFNRFDFAGVITQALRVTMLNTRQSTGILEWRVFGTATGQAAEPPVAVPPQGNVPYQAIENEFVHLDITAANSAYQDSDRFRVYYAADGKNGGRGNLAEVPPAQVANGLAHLEAAYECFVTEWGFRSASLPLNRDDGPFYKMNLYSTTTLNAGGAMGADGRAGLSFIELKDNAINQPGIVVHEFGHTLNYSAYRWNSQNATGAWWESVANWFTDTYFTDPLCESVRARRGLPVSMNTIINLDANIVLSHLPIVHTRNYYQAWPFITYLTNNPDGYDGLGRMILKDLFDNHLRNNETPLHVLARLTNEPVQAVLGRYWARMAYLDIDHPKAQARYFSTLNNGNFRSRAFTNLDDLGGGRYRVKTDKQPQYGGANIIPLTLNGNGGDVSVSVTNLGNGLAGSNFTATLSIRDANLSTTRYVTLQNGSGQASITATEELSLVVVNTPDSLIQFDAFQSSETTPDSIGLNYEVQINGASPTHL